MYRLTFLLALLTLIPVVTVPAAAQLSHGTLSAERVPDGSAPTLPVDHDSAWLNTPPTAATFIQIEPFDGQSSRFPTRVWLRYDSDKLYVLFICDDPDPDSVAHLLQRRDRSSRSDFVTFGISPFGDAKNGYWFRVTAGNVQTDATMSNVNSSDSNWDGVWSSSVAKTETGWQALLEIPFDTFRHGDPERKPWTVVFERFVHRAQEWSTLPAFDRRAQIRIDGFLPVTGLTGIPGSSHVELIPHAVARWDDSPADEWRSENDWDNVGITGKIVLNPSWSVDATYQPDFAQVDVDDIVINLSDYPVFLSEKRPFFLEGLDLFQQQPIQLVYTRRIADPVYGVRVTGQEPTVRASGLYASNLNEDGQREDDFAARALWSVSDRNTLGGTVTHQHVDGENVSAAAFDATLRWGRRNETVLIGAVSDVPGWDEQPVSVESETFVEGPWQVEMNYEAGFRGRDFMINHLGWGRYSDQIWNWARLQRRWFPRDGVIENYRFYLNLYQESHQDTRYGFGTATLGYATHLRNTWGWGVFGYYGDTVRRNYLDEDETTDRMILTDNFGDYVTERYDSWSYNAWVESDYRKPLHGYLEAAHQSLRDGQRVYVNPDLYLTPRNNLTFSVALRWSHVWQVYDIANGSETDFRVWRFGVDWSPVLNTSIRGTLQYVDNSNDDAQQLLANVVFAWNWHPGSWFYVVYGENRDESDVFNARPGDRTIRLKATWFVTSAL